MLRQDFSGTGKETVSRTVFVVQETASLPRAVSGPYGIVDRGMLIEWLPVFPAYFAAATAWKAWSRSQIMSSAVSVPMDSRIVF